MRVANFVTGLVSSCWPVIGFILLIVMVILTVVNAIPSGKKAAA